MLCNEVRMMTEEKDISYMHEYFPARLEEQTVNKLQQLEQEISKEFGDKVILMAFTPKRESWGDY